MKRADTHAQSAFLSTAKPQSINICLRKFGKFGVSLPCNTDRTLFEGADVSASRT